MTLRGSSDLTNGGTVPDSCPFCEPAPDLVLAESKHARILFADGPFIDGHLIVASRDHLGAATDLSPSHLVNLLDLRKAAKKVLETVSGERVVHFEHGESLSASVETLTSHCHHPHLNLAPCSALCDESEAIIGALHGFGLRSTASIDADIDGWYSSASDLHTDYYLFAADSQFYILHGPSTVDRVFRRAFARVLGFDEESAARWETALGAGRPRSALSEQVHGLFTRKVM